MRELRQIKKNGWFLYMGVAYQKRDFNRDTKSYYVHNWHLMSDQLMKGDTIVRAIHVLL